ncbi:Zcf27p [Sporothrix curviconia]|uniref:Zcf27p n=1 Tax=Sporothrix curviconia TaxID=1260050 RepID=A0ABP0CPL7_9PEZI
MQSSFSVDEAAASAKRRRKSGDSWQPAPPSRIAGSYQRTKAPSACLVCRTRKTKCDNVRPVCGFCQRTGGDCHYSESERSRFDPASLAILQQLDDLKNIVQGHTLLLQQQQEANAHRSPSQTSPQSSVGTGLGGLAGGFLPANANSASATTGSYYDTPLNTLNTLNASAYDPISPTALEKPGATHGFDQHGRIHRNSDGGQNPQTHDARRAFDRYAAKVQTDTDMPIGTEAMMNAAADMGIESMLRWPLFKRKLDALKVSSFVSVVSLMETPVPGTDTDTVDGMPLKQMEPFDEPGFVDRARIMDLVDNFLVNNNLKNPILGPAGLRADAEIFAASPLATTGRNCLMYLILAISTLSIPFTETSTGRRVKVARSEHAFAVAEAYFHEAQQRMGCLMCADSLLAARCGFLTGVYLMHTLRILPAWKAFIQAGSSCVSYFIAQNRVDTVPDPRNAGSDGSGPSSRRADAPSTSTERALEDALYWSVLKSEVELRLELGLPGSGINAIRYPHVFPCVPDMEIDGHAVSVDSEGFLVTNQPEVDRSHLTFGWFFFLAEITLKRLMYRIINSRYQLGLGHDDERPREHSGRNGHSTDDANIQIDPTVLDTAEYDLQLEQWMQLLPPAMQFPVSWTEPPTDILPWVLRGHGIDAVELLRFPAFAAVMRIESPLSPLNTPASSASTDAYTENMRQNLTRLVREYLQNAVNRIEANANGVFHRHQGTWLAIRSCTRSALALLGTRLAMQEQRDLAVLQGFAVGGTVPGGSPVDTVLMDSLLPPQWKDAVQLVRDMLHAWEPEGRDVAHLATVLEGLFSLCDDIE